jgi:hypothetical protein
VADPAVRVEVEGLIVPSSFEDLAAELAAVGFEATSRPGPEHRDPGQAVWEIVLWLRDDAGPDAIGILLSTSVAWVRIWLRQRARRPERVTVKILGPNGRVLQAVRVDEDG